jgi:ParB family chromosome partitioning protein
MEEAQAYRRLADEFHLTQEQIADAVGKDRSSVANMTRLLRLPLEVRENVAAGTIGMGHARALLSLPDEASQLRWGREVVSKQLSVRETEVLVKKALTPDTPRETPQKDVHTRAAEDRLRFALGTPVRIVRKPKGGRIEVDFGSEEELQRLYDQMVDKK